MQRIYRIPNQLNASTITPLNAKMVAFLVHPIENPTELANVCAHRRTKVRNVNNWSLKIITKQVMGQIAAEFFVNRAPLNKEKSHAVGYCR